MKVLVVKTSSLGDIIHTLPAVTDLRLQNPSAEIHWVVEKSFSEIPSWHSDVKKVIAIPLRRWIGNPIKAIFSQEFRDFYRELRQERYDYVIDAQGLMKSAFIGLLARGKKYGLDFGSARELLAPLAYTKRYKVSWEPHAVVRLRELFSKIFSYDYKQCPLDYGLNKRYFTMPESSPYVMFLHGTTWETKHWPEEYWVGLAKKVTEAGYFVMIPWGNEDEHARAKRIAAQSLSVKVLPKCSLKEVAGYIAGASALVAVDTGLGHLSAALHQSTLSLYGPTSHALTGTYGIHQQHMQSKSPCSPCLKKQCRYKRDGSLLFPCYDTLTPQSVWENLQRLLPIREKSL